VYAGYKNHWRSEEMLEGIRVIRVWTFLAPNQGFARRIANFISYMLVAVWQALFVRQVDLLVATSPQFFCGLAGVLVKWCKRVPFVLEIRDLWPDSIVAVGAMKKSRLIRVLEWFERRMYAAANHIVTVGTDYKRGLISKGVPWNKISVVPNGVDPKAFRFEGDRERIRRELGVNDHFVCGYVGTVGMAHGLEVMLDAAQLAQRQGPSNVLFWIVGDGARRAELQRLANERGLANVRFAGLMPKDKMPAVIAACDAFLVHLRGTELFATVLPSKIFEAMAVGTPIVCGVRGQAQEIVCEADAGVAMTPDTPEELLWWLAEIRSMGRESFDGREYLAANFNRDKLAYEMLAVLEKTAGLPAPSSKPIDVPQPQRKAA
jgi:glycosyltransferase involved in cell wall biosynthesis